MQLRRMCHDAFDLIFPSLLSTFDEPLPALRQRQLDSKDRKKMQERDKKFLHSKGATETTKALPVKSAAEVGADVTLTEKFLLILGNLGVRLLLTRSSLP